MKRLKVLRHRDPAFRFPFLDPQDINHFVLEASVTACQPIRDWVTQPGEVRIPGIIIGRRIEEGIFGLHIYTPIQSLPSRTKQMLWCMERVFE